MGRFLVRLAVLLATVPVVVACDAAGGAERVVAVGASIGAMASLHAAAQPDNGLHGVVWLAGVLRNRHYEFQPTQVAAVACPLMLISGDKTPTPPPPTHGRCTTGRRAPANSSSSPAHATAPRS